MLEWLISLEISVLELSNNIAEQNIKRNSDSLTLFYGIIIYPSIFITLGFSICSRKPQAQPVSKEGSNINVPVIHNIDTEL